MKGGRPLRFLAAVLGGWIAARGVALWPVEDPVAAMAAAIGPGRAEAAVPVHRVYPRVSAPRSPLVMATAAAAPAPIRRMAANMLFERTPLAAPLLTSRMPPPEPQVERTAPAPLLPPPLVPTPLARGPSRFAGSAWLIARGGSNEALLGGQLGASQAGVRLTYAVDTRRRIALAARLATPLAGSGREGAVGLDWQPTPAPLHVVVEQRFALDGGRGGPTLGVIGGFGPSEIAPGIRVEGYGQAGVIARDGGEGFADGAVRIAHPVAVLGRAHLDVGAGAWGGAQRGAARLDAGPFLGLSVPVGDRAVRLSLDWRQRIAGRARPGSGPALSIGRDF